MNRKYETSLKGSFNFTFIILAIILWHILFTLFPQVLRTIIFQVISFKPFDDYIYILFINVSKFVCFFE